jgi:hypothetical protein
MQVGVTAIQREMEGSTDHGFFPQKRQAVSTPTADPPESRMDGSTSMLRRMSKDSISRSSRRKHCATRAYDAVIDFDWSFVNGSATRKVSRVEIKVT